MFKNKFLLLLLCILMILGSVGLVGCGNDTEPPEEPAEEVQDFIVKLYFANEEYIQTGDETLEKFMPVYDQVIPGDTTNVYLDTLEALKTVPDEEGYATLITQDIKFNDVYVEEKTAFVDLQNSGLAGGSLSEIYLISQIVRTLIDSFEEIVEVQFLVDGEVVESLMGHFDASQPFTKDAFSE